MPSWSLNSVSTAQAGEVLHMFIVALLRVPPLVGVQWIFGGIKPPPCPPSNLPMLQAVISQAGHCSNTATGLLLLQQERMMTSSPLTVMSSCTLVGRPSLVPRISTPPTLITCSKWSKTGGVEGLGMRLGRPCILPLLVARSSCYMGLNADI